MKCQGPDHLISLRHTSKRFQGIWVIGIPPSAPQAQLSFDGVRIECKPLRYEAKSHEMLKNIIASSTKLKGIGYNTALIYIGELSALRETIQKTIKLDCRKEVLC